MKIRKSSIIVGIVVFMLTFYYLKTMDIKERTEKPFIGWSKYENKEHSFSLEYPKGWDVKENEPFGVIVGFIGPRKSDSVVSISVVVSYLEEPVDFDTILEENIKAGMEKDKTFELLSKDKVTIGDKEAGIFKASIPIEDKKSILMFTTIKCNDKKILGIACGSHVDLYNELEPLFLHTIYSVKC